MKKFGLILLAACAALGLGSCNDNSNGGSYYGPTFVTVHTFGGITSDYYFVSDNNEKIYVGDRSRVGSYEAQDGNRALITYQLLDQKKEGYDYNIKLYAIEDIRWGATEKAMSQEQLDLLGSAKTSLLRNVYNQYMCGASSEVLNMALAYNSTSEQVKNHLFTLVKPDFADYVPEETENGYLNLELRHKAPEGETTSNVFQEWLSFRLDNFAADLVGMKGIIVTMKPLRPSNGEETFSVKIDFWDKK